MTALKYLVFCVAGFIVGFSIKNPLIATPYQTTSPHDIDNTYYTARNKAEDLVKTDYFEHTGLDGLTLRDRVFPVFSGGVYGENLYRGVCSIKNAMRLWEESLTHNAVLDLKPIYAVLLILPNEDGKCYAVYEVIGSK